MKRYSAMKKEKTIHGNTLAEVGTYGFAVVVDYSKRNDGLVRFHTQGRFPVTRPSWSQWLPMPEGMKQAGEKYRILISM